MTNPVTRKKILELHFSCLSACNVSIQDERLVVASDQYDVITDNKADKVLLYVWGGGGKQTRKERFVGKRTEIHRAWKKVKMHAFEKKKKKVL